MKRTAGREKMKESKTDRLGEEGGNIVQFKVKKCTSVTLQQLGLWERDRYVF